MPSLFYKATFERRFPLSFLLFEELGLRIEEKGGEEVDPGAYIQIVSDALKKCLGMDKVTEEDVQYVSDRLTEAIEEKEEKQPEEGKHKRTFASSFSDWVSKLSPHEICMTLTGYDYVKALYLYENVDRDDVLEMSKQWMKKEWEHIKVGYESVVYGFGGGYEDKPHTEVDVSSDDHLEGKVIKPSALALCKF